jgi:hypothetical protein
MARLSMKKKMNKKVAAKKSVRRSKSAKGGKRGKSKRTINKRKTTKQKGGWSYKTKCPVCKKPITQFIPADTDYTDLYQCYGQKCFDCGNQWCLEYYPETTTEASSWADFN